MNTIVFILLFIPGAFPQTEWDLKKDKSGIEIYTRKVEGSAFEEFKGIVIIQNTSLYNVLNVITDVENFESLFADCMNPKVLKQDGKWNDIHYIQTKGPFPVKDRDSVFEQKTTISKDGKNARVSLISLPDYIPEVQDIVRIRVGAGFWELKEDNNNVMVIYQFHSEPGGDVPAMLVNSFMVKHPFKTLENLKKRVKVNKQTNEY